MQEATETYIGPCQTSTIKLEGESRAFKNGECKLLNIARSPYIVTLIKT